MKRAQKISLVAEEEPAEETDWDDDESLPLPNDGAQFRPPLSSPKEEMEMGTKEIELDRSNSSRLLSESHQPMSLELKSSITPSKRRRGSRKTRSLRSTHIAMMSRPLVLDAKDLSTLDKGGRSGSSSNSSSFSGRGFF